MSEERKTTPDLGDEGAAVENPLSFFELYSQMLEQAIENFVRTEITGEGALFDQMEEGIKYRRVLIDRVHKHWEESRFANGAFDLLMQNQSTKKLGVDLYGAYNDYIRNSVEDKVLPWHESMRLVHLLMASVYGISFEEQQALTPEFGEEWVQMMGTTEDLVNDADHRAKAEQEVQVIESYMRQYRDFNARYFPGVFGKSYGFEEATMKEKMVTTANPGTAKRQAFFVLLHVQYGLDPRNRELLFQPSDDPEVQAKQEKLLAMEAQLVDEIVAYEVADRFRTVRLGDYLNVDELPDPSSE